MSLSKKVTHEITEGEKVSFVARPANRTQGTAAPILKAENGTTYHRGRTITKTMKRVMENGDIVEAVGFFKGDEFLGYLLPNGELDRRDLSKSITKASYQPPATPGEELNDTAEKQARRAEVEVPQALEREITELEDQYRTTQHQPGLSAAAREQQLYALAVEINAKRQQLHSLRDPRIAKSVDQFDLMMMHISPAHVARAGTSQAVDAGTLQSEISKDERDFWAELNDSSLGVRRPKDSIVKGGVEIPLSDPFGIRNKRLLGR